MLLMQAIPRGGPPQFDQAKLWYTKASKLGDPVAPFAIGQMYESRWRDLEQAAHWYKISSKRGHIDATAALNRLQNA